MACLDCLEKRGKVLRAMGLGRFAPNIPQRHQQQLANGIAPIANVDGRAAVSEIDAQATIREQFARYLAASSGSSAKDIVYASVHLISFALGQACAEKKCADEQIEAVCDTLKRALQQKYDAETGKRREIVMAQVMPF